MEAPNPLRVPPASVQEIRRASLLLVFRCAVGTSSSPRLLSGRPSFGCTRWAFARRRGESFRCRPPSGESGGPGLKRTRSDEMKLDAGLGGI
eukprot:scaffold1282_cov251-Pinguiococcus_pyrenoidosus.AAC.19